jgi:hypothetical protein
MREPIDALDVVRACATALGSNTDIRDGGRENESSLWTSKAGDAKVAMVALDVVRGWFDFGSNREARSGEGGLTEKGLLSSSFASTLEPIVAVE